jgi:hypothetical protein
MDAQQSISLKIPETRLKVYLDSNVAQTRMRGHAKDVQKRARNIGRTSCSAWRTAECEMLCTGCSKSDKRAEQKLRKSATIQNQ